MQPKASQGSTLPKVRAVIETYPTFSHPYLIRANDGELYVLKHGNSKLPIAIEHFATNLGKRILAPVVDCCLIEVEEGSDDLFTSCKGYQPGIPIPAPGTYFATRFLMNSQPLSNVPQDGRRMILNKDKAAISVIYDTWLDNVDRHEGNILVVLKEPNKKSLASEDASIEKQSVTRGFYVYLIDQGHVFGGPELTALQNMSVITPRLAVKDYFGVTNDLIKDQLRSQNALLLSKEDVKSVLQLTPKDWWENFDTTTILDFVTTRTSSVVSTILSALS